MIEYVFKKVLTFGLNAYYYLRPNKKPNAKAALVNIAMHVRGFDFIFDFISSEWLRMASLVCVAYFFAVSITGCSDGLIAPPKLPSISPSFSWFLSADLVNINTPGIVWYINHSRK
jgi:hypothetical protein